MKISQRQTIKTVVQIKMKQMVLKLHLHWHQMTMERILTVHQIGIFHFGEIMPQVHLQKLLLGQTLEIIRERKRHE